MLGLDSFEKLLAQQSIMPRQLNLCHDRGLKLHQFALAQCCAWHAYQISSGSSHRIHRVFFSGHDSLLPDNRYCLVVLGIGCIREVPLAFISRASNKGVSKC